MYSFSGTLIWVLYPVSPTGRDWLVCPCRTKGMGYACDVWEPENVYRRMGLTWHALHRAAFRPVLIVTAPCSASLCILNRCVLLFSTALHLNRGWRGVSNLRPRIAMNVTPYKIVNLLRTWGVFLGVCVCLCVTMYLMCGPRQLLPVLPRDA